MMELLVPPGAPTVPRAGPAFPAELTKWTPWTSTAPFAREMKEPMSGVEVASP